MAVLRGDMTTGDVVDPRLSAMAVAAAVAVLEVRFFFFLPAVSSGPKARCGCMGVRECRWLLSWTLIRPQLLTFLHFSGPTA
jgi:hypothetical protein